MLDREKGLMRNCVTDRQADGHTGLTLYFFPVEQAIAQILH